MKRFTKISTILFLVISVAFLFSSAVFAQGTGSAGSGDSVELTNPLGDDTIIGVINTLVTGLRDTIAPPIVALAVLYGGFLMLFSSGDPEKFAKGKKAIAYAVAGYVIILVSSGITMLIENILTGGG